MWTFGIDSASPWLGYNIDSEREMVSLKVVNIGMPGSDLCLKEIILDAGRRADCI